MSEKEFCIFHGYEDMSYDSSVGIWYCMACEEIEKQKADAEKEQPQND